MLIQSISQIKHNKIQSNSKRSNNISQKTVNNVTLPSFADAKSLANINFKGVIHNYARDGYAYLVLEKIEEGVSVNDRGTDYNTPLIVACDNGKTKVVEKLLEHPDIDVNARNVHGTTALMAVCRSKSDNTAIAEKLLNRPEIDVNIKNRDKVTALIWACCAGKTKIVEKLIDRPDIDVNAQNITGGTALMFAAFLGFADIAEKILKHPDVDVNLKDNKGKTASDYADAKIAGMIKSYQKGIDKRGINKDSDYKIGVGINEYVAEVNKRDNDGNTALMLASFYGWTDEVKKLLADPEIDVNMRHSTGDTALMDACSNGNTEVVEQLLQHPKIDVNAQNREGFTALMYAANRDNAKIAEKLINHPDIDVNAQNEYGNTALIIASYYGNTKAAEKLLQHPNIDISLRDDDNYTALDWANINKHHKIAQMIKDYKRGVDKRGINKDSGYKIGVGINEYVAEVNKRDNDGNTALMLASFYGWTDEVKKLLADPEIDVNMRHSTGVTALMDACSNGNTEVVDQLLQHPEIDVNAQNREGFTALMYAASNKYTDIVDKLIRYSETNVNIQNKEGNTALNIAGSWGNKEEVKKILEHPDVDVNIKNRFGHDVFYYADKQISRIIRGYKRGIDKRGSIIQRQLPSPVLDVTTRNDKDNIPLIGASIFGKKEEVEKLLKNPEVDINAQNEGGNTALMLACNNGQTEIVEKLLQQPDIDVNIQNEHGDTALMYAAVCGYKEVAEKLLQHPDVDVNIKNKSGNDALYYASAVKNPDGEQIVQMIKNYKRGVSKRVIEVIQRGNRKDSEDTVSEVNKPDINGKTPLMRASISKNMDEIDELLKDPEIDVNARGAIGCTALMCASNIGNGNAEVVEKLLQHPDVNVNAQSSNGWTALHWACNGYYTKVVEKLLEHPDIDVNIKDVEGRDASSLANNEISQMIKNYRRGVDKRAKVLPKVFDFSKFVSSKEFSTEEIENAVRRSVTKKIREEERIKANKKVEDKIAELDKIKSEYEEKNRALDNLINDYQAILADDVEDAKSGFKALYGIKSEVLPENMGLGEQMIYIIDIMNKNKNKLINMDGESPEKITKTLQDNNGNISNDGLKFLDRILQISDKSCSEGDLISAINSVKNKNGYIDMKKAAYLIANLSWGQNKISDIIDKVERYKP